MSDESKIDPRVVTEAEAVANLKTGLRLQLRQMLQALRGSALRWILVGLSLGVIVVIGCTAYGQIRLNSWNKPFYDAISRRDLGDFLHELAVFLVIAGGLLVLNVAQRWLQETMKLRLREALVEDLAEHWMQPRRAFWLAHSGPMGVNPDQRMHDDTRKLCELSTDLGTGLLQATVLFSCFAGVLWGLSSQFHMHLGGQVYTVPGYMLWAAILYSGIGGLLSYRVGRNLIGRNAERYAREADLRYSLVRINEHLDDISLAGGEADERRRVRIDLRGVLEATRLLVLSLTNLTWITASFGWVTNIFPVLVAAPLYFTGEISFGGLIMAAAAFTQVEVSLRWFVDNFSLIADWRATLQRVAGFRQALTDPALMNGEGNLIIYEDGEPGCLELQDLEVEFSSGRYRLDERHLRVHAGQRLFIAVPQGAPTTPMFMALAALWPLGAGRVIRPRGERIFYVPRGMPYLPPGSLRAVLAYPQPEGRFANAALERVLCRMGLDRLVPMLDAVRRWDRELDHDEQMSLALARAVVQRPDWVLLDDAFGAVDAGLLARFVEIMRDELGAVGVIHVGRVPEERGLLFSRVVNLRYTPADAASVADEPSSGSVP